MTQSSELKAEVKQHHNGSVSMIMYYLHYTHYHEANQCVFGFRSSPLFWLGHRAELLHHIKEAGVEMAIEQTVQRFRQDHARVIVELIALKNDNTVPTAVEMLEQFIHDSYKRYLYANSSSL